MFIPSGASPDPVTCLSLIQGFLYKSLEFKGELC